MDLQEKILFYRKVLASGKVNKFIASEVREHLNKAQLLASTNNYAAQRQIELAERKMAA